MQWQSVDYFDYFLMRCNPLPSKTSGSIKIAINYKTMYTDGLLERGGSTK